MQKAILLISAFAISVSAYAQQPLLEQFKPQRLQKPAQLEKARSFEKRSENKTTALLHRIKSYSVYNDQGGGLTLSDTTIYKYSNGRGSSFDYQEMYVNDYGYSNGIYSDTSLVYSSMSGALEPDARYSSIYDANRNRTSHINESYYSGKFTNSIREQVSYNSNGDITNVKTSFWNTSTNAWDLTYGEYNTYNAQNRLIKDSSYDFNMSEPSYVFLYEYDVNNQTRAFGLGWNSGTATFDTFYVEGMSYYANNKLKTDTVSYVDTNGIVMYSYIDTFGYDNTDFPIYYEYRDYDDINYMYYPSYRETRTLNGSKLPANQRISFYDTSLQTWDIYAEADWYYNSNNEPYNAKAYMYNNGTKEATPFSIYNIYYENYFPANIKDVATSSFSIYPNPAKNQVIFNAESRIQKAYLYNINGQIVASTPVNNTRSGSLNVNGLLSGNYFLVLTSIDGNAMKQQIVIAE